MKKNSVHRLKEEVWDLMDQSEALSKQLTVLSQGRKQMMERLFAQDWFRNSHAIIAEGYRKSGELFRERKSGKISEMDCFRQARDCYRRLVDEQGKVVQAFLQIFKESQA